MCINNYTHIQINYLILNALIAGHGPHRISFYPRGMNKSGHTVCSFAAPKNCGRLTWMITSDLNDAAKKWESFQPSGIQPTRLQSVEFTDLARACMVRMLDEAGGKSTCNQIASRLNDPNTVGYRFSGNREYNRFDVQRELNRLFPPAMDVAQTYAYLQELKRTPEWADLGIQIGNKQ